MNNIYKLIIFIPFFILGCSPIVIKENQSIQKINSLEMNIFSNKGEKLYSINSPHSSFDGNESKFNSKNTTINIFNGEKIQYIINSDDSTLSNNNKLLELIGNVKLKTFGKDGEILYADNFTWNIDESNYLLEGNIKFENKNIILNSGQAILGEDEIIEFFNPVKYIIKDGNNKNTYEINSENAYYDINTESVIFNSKKKRVQSIIYF